MTATHGGRPPAITTAMQIARLRRMLVAWGPVEGRTYPWRTSSDDYLRLLAEVLLQRTRAGAVAAVWPLVVRSFPTARRLAAATDEELILTVRPLGLGLKRARYLKHLGESLVQLGTVPTNFAELGSLPGVGPYSAGAFLASSRGERTAPVDANVRRVLGRVAMGVVTADRKVASTLVSRLLSRGDATVVFHALLDFGSSPCRPRQPLCGSCPGRSFCLYGPSGLQAGQVQAGESAVTTMDNRTGMG